MTHRSPAPFRITRRTALGTLGAASLATGFTWASPGFADSSRRRGPDKDLLPGGAFDRFVAEQAAQDVFSGTVLLAHRDRPVLTRAYGMADQRQGVPNRPDTLFNLASVTKCFTGLAIAQLVVQGKVAFHEKLGTYLGGFPAEIADVTVQQLLTHTSGVGRPALGGGIWPTWNSVEETVEGTLGIIRSTPLQFAPGTRFGYSNDGYWVLGAIVAQVSGGSYYDYVRRHVFAPAGMTRTDFLTRPQVLADPDVARPYWTQPSGARVDFTTTPMFGFVGGPDGGAYSTAPDLLRFASALRAGRLLDPAYTELVTTAKVPVPPRPGSPATEREFADYGFHDFVVAGQPIYGHPGSGPGVATNLDVHPGSDWVAIVLGNYDSGVKAIVQREREISTRRA
ncbi:serine hydrolase [Microtetraspora sp. NBRC 13810]|uniref:serine hydrolase domain-containing protein n=1 Tax=Microtetraspora sp. NBRC 13810 TaxID=3030990 RepID=UPI0024A4E5CF|nr:serine hydrolase domain-containing protein [Microtetraspora sp. NBRC 13810]GLW12681.1 serine hydrolase [Microtetraspora sp. NBRC 13810]